VYQSCSRSLQLQVLNLIVVTCMCFQHLRVLGTVNFADILFPEIFCAYFWEQGGPCLKLLLYFRKNLFVTRFSCHCNSVKGASWAPFFLSGFCQFLGFLGLCTLSCLKQHFAFALQVAADADIEEEDGDTIERVLWHQPKGIADEEAEEGRHAEPFVLDTDPHAELNWDEQEFYIKWKGQSYLHCQWQLLSDLSQLSGYKKVLNYMKKIEDDRQIRQTLSAEEAELHDVSKEMELDLLKQYRQVQFF
jgi:hypothetical protein